MNTKEITEKLLEKLKARNRAFYGGLGMPAPRMNHSMACKTIYDELFSRLAKSEKLDCRHLDREAPVFNWGEVGEIQPDIVYFDIMKFGSGKNRFANVEYRDPLVFIEVIDKAHRTRPIKNITTAIEHKETIREAFLYNYETDHWTRFCRDIVGNVKEEPNNDYSEVFEMNLSDLFNDY